MSQFSKYLEIVQEGKDYTYNEGIIDKIFNFVFNKDKGLNLAEKAFKLITYHINGYKYGDVRGGSHGFRNREDLQDYIRNNKNATYGSYWTGTPETLDFLQSEGIIENKEFSEVFGLYEEIITKFGDFFKISNIKAGDSKEKFDDNKKMVEYKKGVGQKFEITLDFDELYKNLSKIKAGIKNANMLKDIKELDDFLTYTIASRPRRVANQ